MFQHIYILQICCIALAICSATKTLLYTIMLQKNIIEHVPTMKDMDIHHHIVNCLGVLLPVILFVGYT